MTAVMSYDPHYCPVCEGDSVVAVQMVSGRPLGLIRTLPCPAHVDATALVSLVERVCPPTPPDQRGAA